MAFYANRHEARNGVVNYSHVNGVGYSQIPRSLAHRDWLNQPQPYHNVVPGSQWVSSEIQAPDWLRTGDEYTYALMPMDIVAQLDYGRDLVHQRLPASLPGPIDNIATMSNGILGVDLLYPFMENPEHFKQVPLPAWYGF